MNCQECQAMMAALIDNELDAPGRARLEQHVGGCQACRALLADLKSIQAAAFTLPRHAVTPQVWPAVSAALARERPQQVQRFGGGRVVWWAAAAALLLMTSGTVFMLTRPPAVDPSARAVESEPAPAPTSAEAVASVQAELEAATAHYQNAITQLDQIARSGNEVLEPQVAAVLQKSLQVIDSAIDENQSALQSQPESTVAREGLFEALRSKVTLLQQTVELINEMRKGNQAEAGRLLEGLNR